jgi:hypothetical protein
VPLINHVCVQLAYFVLPAGEPFRFRLAFFPAFFLSFSVRTSGLVGSWCTICAGSVLWAAT